MVRTKLCGLGTEADVHAAVDAGADALGFITDVGVDTPREVSPDRARELATSVPPFVTTVAVTIPESVDDAVDVAARVDTDALQVHGDFAPDEVRAIRERAGVDVIVALGADEPERARDLDGVADALLVDSLTEEGAGGTGETHDWAATRELRHELSTPLVLAGGLTPGNVHEAVGTVEPFAVDVASGVERADEPGRKDHDALRAFVREATRTAHTGTA
ncbi:MULTISPECIES: phosphoribosylanthranilate isomerase [Halolamina]|uniref:N-(5'-phosphoribosyl)anthranilate isomerase n=1 Tax=Halolamina pelagica TaxID=699431 RepID=A0A1I5Q801_9EURY|nr:MULTISPECIES: phosphoribosylanthranilate isomerase [Halolamina]NHX35130.1 phosphoribosylanthranilate isomerase [Halolamina sp. R1-12]SFP42170.1 phosphoribosylanthranilate isomerase [Halolamina pelagica]